MRTRLIGYTSSSSTIAIKATSRRSTGESDWRMELTVAPQPLIGAGGHLCGVEIGR